MKVSVSLSNADATVGFVTISDFRGPKAIVSVKHLKDAITLLNQFEEIGYTSENLSIGIENATSQEGHNLKDLIVLFLDKTQTFGIALASILPQEGEK